MTDERGPPRYEGLECPLPLRDYPTVQLAHGGGGWLSKMLVDDLFLPAFANPALAQLHDGAVLETPLGRIAFTTDSYVVQPLFFPGGDIGSLAVHGTVNDLAMCGARPLALSTGYVLEEGFDMETLWKVASSMRDAAREAGVPIVTGDTKVVDRGKADGLFINTAGIGLVPDGVDVRPDRVRPGDVVLLSGEIALHGIAVMSLREGFALASEVLSDSAALHDLVGGLLDRLGMRVHVLRDPTRGGVASALNEIAQAAGVGVVLREDAIPVREDVRGACELLGFDPLYVANEGKCLAIVEPEVAEEALSILRAHPLGKDAVILGEVVEDAHHQVHLETSIGGRRVVDMLSGEQLPRIC
jgi:hydrogenase expression/formation protein HypE